MKLIRRFTSLVLIVMLGLGITFFHSVSSVQAGSVDGGTVMSLTCTSAEFSPAETGVIHFDRDTTGDNGERLRLTVTDGKGNVLLDVYKTKIVGSTDSFSTSYSFTSAPVANPISASFYSPAGNSLPEQTLLTATFNCPGLSSGSTDACTYPLPEGSVVYNVPDGARAYYAADPGTYTNFNLPPGTWYISGSDDAYAKVWIACSAQPIYIPVGNVLR